MISKNTEGIRRAIRLFINLRAHEKGMHTSVSSHGEIKLRIKKHK